MEEIFLKTKQKILREKLNQSTSEQMNSIIIEISNIQKSISNIKLKYTKYEQN